MQKFGRGSHLSDGELLLAQKLTRKLKVRYRLQAAMAHGEAGPQHVGRRFMMPAARLHMDRRRADFEVEIVSWHRRPSPHYGVRLPDEIKEELNNGPDAVPDWNGELDWDAYDFHLSVRAHPGGDDDEPLFIPLHNDEQRTRTCYCSDHHHHQQQQHHIHHHHYHHHPPTATSRRPIGPSLAWWWPPFTHTHTRTHAYTRIPEMYTD